MAMKMHLLDGRIDMCRLQALSKAEVFSVEERRGSSSSLLQETLFHTMIPLTERNYSAGKMSG